MTPEAHANNEYLKSLRPGDPNSFEFKPIPPPSSPDAYCTLHAIRAGQVGAMPARTFIQGVNDTDILVVPVFAFLIEKNVEGKVVRVLFELGLRPEEEFTDPNYLALFDALKIRCANGVAQILQKSGITLESISTLFLGHAHFDHIGNLSIFPPSMSMIVGPGSPMGQDLANDMSVDLRVIEERDVRQLTRDSGDWEDIGCFKGIDYFGDGSLWLLDTPGHTPGHMTALVRTSTSPPTYHLLGSDTAHDIALIRAPGERPLAGIFPANTLDPSGDPLVLLSMHADLATAYESMAKMERMDSEENLNVFLAHDVSMETAIPAGDIVRMAGTAEELKKLKERNRIP